MLIILLKWLFHCLCRVFWVLGTWISWNTATNFVTNYPPCAHFEARHPSWIFASGCLVNGVGKKRTWLWVYVCNECTSHAHLTLARLCDACACNHWGDVWPGASIRTSDAGWHNSFAAQLAASLFRLIFSFSQSRLCKLRLLGCVSQASLLQHQIRRWQSSCKSGLIPLIFQRRLVRIISFQPVFRSCLWSFCPHFFTSGVYNSVHQFHLSEKQNPARLPLYHAELHRALRFQWTTSLPLARHQYVAHASLLGPYHGIR